MTRLHPLIDIGLNLASSKFAKDWETVIARAKAKGVAQFILTGTSVDVSQESSRLAEKIGNNVGFFTAGVHPHRSSELVVNGKGDPSKLKELTRLLMHPQAVAVGEAGLDYNRDLSPRPVQRIAFRAQVELACELKKPLFLHEREAAQDLLAILGDYSKDLPRCVVHCFTGDEHEAQEYLDRGFYFGVTGWIGQSQRNASLLRAIKVVPAERLMLETDAPYLAPTCYRPLVRGRNEPEAMVEVAELVAQARGISVAQARSDAFEATSRFFGLN